MELSGWEVHGLGSNSENVHAFKQYASSPPGGSPDMAWPKNVGTPAMFGWFFSRPAMKGKDNAKLLIRRQGITDKANNRCHEAPLCGGYCLFYRDKKPNPETFKSVHKAKLTLALNLQRFIRHQARNDNPLLPHPKRLQRWGEDRSSFEEEFAFDEEDNWVPDTPDWRDFAGKEHFKDYLDLIAKRVHFDFQRACKFQNAAEAEETPNIELKRCGKPYSLSAVETLWEFPSNNPIADVLQIGAKLMHLKRAGVVTKIKRLVFKEANRVVNSPCFVIPVAQGVKLKLYAKTNKRIRFEIVQTGLRRELAKLVEEADNLQDPWVTALASKSDSLFSMQNIVRSSDELPAILKALRQRASVHMNQIMTEMRKGRDKQVKACSVVNLLAQIAAAVPSGFKSNAKRLSEIQNLLFLLCYQRGFRGSRKQGPYSAALSTLEAAGVLEFDRSRLFYVLTDSYVMAADALISATGDPILHVFGMSWGAYPVQKGGTLPVRLRE